MWAVLQVLCYCIFDLLHPAVSLSLGQELHLAEGTSQSLEQQFGTILRPICDSTRSHCCHLDKNWNSICLSNQRTWVILFKSHYTNVRIIIIIILSENTPNSIQFASFITPLAPQLALSTKKFDSLQQRRNTISISQLDYYQSDLRNFWNCCIWVETSPPPPTHLLNWYHE